MPKKKDRLITIQQLPEVQTNLAYESRLKSIKIDRRKNVLKIVLENLDATQYGRSHTILLPLPACPGNPTCLFLEACGIDTPEIGKQVDLDSLIGKTLHIKFVNTEAVPFDYKSIVFIKTT